MNEYWPAMKEACLNSTRRSYTKQTERVEYVEVGPEVWTSSEVQLHRFSSKDTGANSRVASKFSI